MDYGKKKNYPKHEMKEGSHGASSIADKAMSSIFDMLDKANMSKAKGKGGEEVGKATITTIKMIDPKSMDSSDYDEKGEKMSDFKKRAKKYK